MARILMLFDDPSMDSAGAALGGHELVIAHDPAAAETLLADNDNGVDVIVVGEEETVTADELRRLAGRRENIPVVRFDAGSLRSFRCAVDEAADVAARRRESGRLEELAEMRTLLSAAHGAGTGAPGGQLDYRKMVEVAREGIWIIDKDAHTLFVNPALAEMFGYETEEMVGRHLFSFMDEHGVEICKENLERREDGVSEQHDFEFLRKDGKRFYTTMATAPILDSEDNYSGAIAGVLDISSRHDAEVALRRSEERFRTLASSSPVGIFRLDADGQCVYVNERAGELTGLTFEQSIGDGWRGALHPEDAPRVLEARKRALGRGGLFSAEYRFLHDDGTVVWVMGNISPLKSAGGERTGFMGTLVDITQRKALEQQVLEARKLEAVGRLAGGIAHDFNNILQAIFAQVELVTRQMEPTDPRRETVHGILEGVERAAALTKQLLAFSRRQLLSRKLVDVNDTVGGVLDLLRRSLGEDIEVSFEASRPLGRIRCDPAQLEQVLLNLFVNARDAMRGGGRLTVCIREIVIDAAKCEALGLLSEGRYVRISVKDTGHGMDDATMGRIFEPFFSTKDPSRGTGLGLSTAYGIIRQHEGAIRVHSAPGCGTKFTFELPVATGGDDVDDETDMERPAGGSETVLIAEDEETVRDLLRSVLEQTGYTVRSVATAADAIRHVEKSGGDIGVVLLDAILPDMGAADVYERIREMRPGLPVILASGYGDDFLRDRVPDADEIVLLRKPFRIDGLLRAIRKALDSRDST